RRSRAFCASPNTQGANGGAGRSSATPTGPRRDAMRTVTLGRDGSRLMNGNRAGRAAARTIATPGNYAAGLGTASGTTTTTALGQSTVSVSTGGGNVPGGVDVYR